MITLAGPSLTYVSWGCRRCGHTGGVARTTVPIPNNWTEEMGRVLFRTLRVHLVKTHQRESQNRGRICVAAPEDFTIGQYIPPGKKVAGLI